MILMRVVSAARKVGRHNPILLEKAVNSISDRNRVAPRLDMHVGCATLDRSRDDLVHEPDDRRFVGDIAQPLDIVFAALVADSAQQSSPTSACASPPAS